MNTSVEDRLTQLCGKSLREASNEELYQALLKLTQECSEKKTAPVKGRKLYYISAEFLIGKLLSNNLINLGLYDEVRRALGAAGKELAELEELENEPSLGNGGLGRLAACFLDSLATLNDLAKYAAIQINDTHPSMVIPELIRLLGEHGVGFDKAVEIVTETCAYTNHTILAEALEKWPRADLELIVPQLMPIIKKLDRLARTRTQDSSTYIIDDAGLVHMAHMDIHFTHSTNGVAALHTQILKDSELSNFYRLYPEKFNNKTNGITFRRWLLECNPALAAWIESLIGGGFKKDARELEKLMDYADNDAVLAKFSAIKRDNKHALAHWLYLKQGVRINPDAMFSIQSKQISLASKESSGTGNMKFMLRSTTGTSGAWADTNAGQ